MTVITEAGENAEDTSKKPIFVRDLDSDVKSRICALLNETSVLKRDYRGLAAKMKYDKDEIELFSRCDNPTNVLLHEWGTQNDATVDNLIKLLEKMKRDDVIEILKEV